MTQPLRLSALLLATVLALAGCGSSDSGSDSSAGTSSSSSASADPGTDASSSPSASDDGQSIDITFDGDTVTPQGKALEVEAGQPLTLNITADQPGELHVHSSPEQEIEYAAGDSTETLTLDQPGVVDIESHTLDKLVVQLEVR